MKQHDIGIEMGDLYKALGKVLGSGPVGSTTIFEVMEDIHEEHDGCDATTCGWKGVANHIGHFACDAITLLQAYAHAVIISHQGIHDQPEEAVHYSFDTIEKRMECLTEGTSAALRAYAKWCAKKEMEKQVDGAEKPEPHCDCDSEGAG